MVENLPVHEEREEEVQEKQPSMVSNFLAIIGFIILIIIIVWGIVHLATLSKPWFSSLFAKSAPAVVITAPTDVTSGMPFQLSWKYSPTVAGNYAILYQCQSGFQMQIQGASGAMSGVPCGAAFGVTSTSSVELTPELSGDSSTTVPVSVVFIPSSGSTGGAQGSASIDVHPAAVQVATNPSTGSGQTTQPSQPVQTKPAPTYSNPAPVYSGPADLSVRIVSESVNAYDTATVVFDITNVGGSPSGTYYFTAELPDESQQPYISSIQYPLAPGAHIQNTLRFTQAVSGTFSVAIGAQDANQSNNYASQWINAAGSYVPGYYEPTTYSPQPTYEY